MNRHSETSLEPNRGTQLRSSVPRLLSTQNRGSQAGSFRCDPVHAAPALRNTRHPPLSASPTAPVTAADGEAAVTVKMTAQIRFAPTGRQPGPAKRGRGATTARFRPPPPPTIRPKIRSQPPTRSTRCCVREPRRGTPACSTLDQLALGWTIVFARVHGSGRLPLCQHPARSVWHPGDDHGHPLTEPARRKRRGRIPKARAPPFLLAMPRRHWEAWPRASTGVVDAGLARR